jgi:3-methyl-2-oxobutanoate hydroxymethyltransferase
MEMVPVEMASEISKRVNMLIWSIVSGPSCNAQYLFSKDILGTSRCQMPHHAKSYRNFATRFDSLQKERVKAFQEYIADITSAAYPENTHVVRMASVELEKFLGLLIR